MAERELWELSNEESFSKSASGGAWAAAFGRPPDCCMSRPCGYELLLTVESRGSARFWRPTTCYGPHETTKHSTLASVCKTSHQNPWPCRSADTVGQEGRPFAPVRFTLQLFQPSSRTIVNLDKPRRLKSSFGELDQRQSPRKPPTFAPWTPCRRHERDRAEQ